MIITRAGKPRKRQKPRAEVFVGQTKHEGRREETSGARQRAAALEKIDNDWARGNTNTNTNTNGAIDIPQEMGVLELHPDPANPNARKARVRLDSSSRSSRHPHGPSITPRRFSPLPSLLESILFCMRLGDEELHATLPEISSTALKTAEFSTSTCREVTRQRLTTLEIVHFWHEILLSPKSSIGRPQHRLAQSVSNDDSVNSKRSIPTLTSSRMVRPLTPNWGAFLPPPRRLRFASWTVLLQTITIHRFLEDELL